MNTSELRSATVAGPSKPLIDFSSLRLRDEDLHPLRMELYHSTGDGYCVFRGFVPPPLVDHMRAVWSTADGASTHQLWAGNEHVYVGGPDYYARYPDGSTAFYNFMFALPLDEVTREVSVAVHMLRNRLSGRNAFDDIWGKRAVSYRVTLNRNWKGHWAAPHRDFMNFEQRFTVKGRYDPSRLQATLFLSEKGRDYQGTGFTLEDNHGRLLRFGEDVPIAAGDLVIWRYGNQHAISDIETRDGQLGFLRIIYPIHEITATGPASRYARAKHDATRLMRRVAGRVTRALRLRGGT